MVSFSCSSRASLSLDELTFRLVVSRFLPLHRTSPRQPSERQTQASHVSSSTTDPVQSTTTPKASVYECEDREREKRRDEFGVGCSVREGGRRSLWWKKRMRSWGTNLTHDFRVESLFLDNKEVRAKATEVRVTTRLVPLFLAQCERKTTSCRLSRSNAPLNLRTFLLGSPGSLSSELWSIGGRLSSLCPALLSPLSLLPSASHSFFKRMPYIASQPSASTSTSHLLTHGQHHMESPTSYSNYQSSNDVELIASPPRPIRSLSLPSLEDEVTSNQADAAIGAATGGVPKSYAPRLKAAVGKLGAVRKAALGSKGFNWGSSASGAECV